MARRRRPTYAPELQKPKRWASCAPRLMCYGKIAHDLENVAGPQAAAMRGGRPPEGGGLAQR